MARPAGRAGLALEQNLAGMSDRGRDETLLGMNARADVLSVAGEGAAFGGRSASLLGRGFFDALHVADRPHALTAVAKAVERRASVALKLRINVSPADAPACFADARLTIHPCSGNPDALARLEIHLSRQDARPRSDADRFLANVSHELRTPLNAILGFSELLADRDLAPRDADKRREYAKIIHESASHLLELVNLVLDASKVEAGKFELNPEPFALAPLIESCCDMLRLKADAGGVSLDCGALGGLGAIVADKRAVKQIIANLLSNAVKFTPQGGRAFIGAAREGSDVVVRVEDNGVGIAKELLARIGEPFFQAHADYDRHFEGAGLGLSLVRGLVGLHGGAMLIHSAPGAGTSVTVRLPVAGAGARPIIAPISGDAPGASRPSVGIVIREERKIA